MQRKGEAAILPYRVFVSVPSEWLFLSKQQQHDVCLLVFGTAL